MILNDRRDLEAIRGTPDFEEALRLILGSTKMWVNRAETSETPDWEEVPVLDTLNRMELTMDEFLSELASAGIAPTTAPAPVAVPLTSEQLEDRVNLERDRRMATFGFSGKLYDLQGQSLANVSGAGTLSLAAIINGAQPGDLRWADPDQDFTWIANDNTIVPMDAQTTWAFAQTAAAWRKHCIYKARALKDMDPIPSDYANDSYWT